MPVQEAAARREIQQHGAGKYRHRPARHFLREQPSEDSFTPWHGPLASLAPLTCLPAGWMQKVDPGPIPLLDPATIPA